MTRLLQQGLVLASVLVLSACGGSDGNYIANTGGGSGTGSGTTTDTSTTTAVKQLDIAASSHQLGSSGVDPVTISAVVKDNNNNVLKDVAVVFSVDNDATIDPDNATAAGSVKTAQLTPGLNHPENRSVTVTVQAGSKTQTLDVEITGTSLQVDGPARIVINSPATFTAKLKDSAGEALAYQTVLLSSSLGNTLTPVSGSGFTTDAKGEVQFTLQSTQAGTDSVTGTALGATFSKTVDISGDEFTLTSANAEVKVNTAETISLLWKKSGVAQAGKTISLAATRGVLPLQVQTDAQGMASFTITSATAGGSVITATDAETGLTAALTKEFVAITPAYLNVQSEQAIIAPGDSVSIVALVRDVNDNPVKHQTVAFNLNDTVNGTLSSSLATTDSLGRATVVYTAGDAISAKDGVVIQTYLPAKPSITDNVTLTVGNRAVRLVLGHD
ncbi:MAG: Ig-like domain-containing protein, partial [Thiolinea sp.]